MHMDLLLQFLLCITIFFISYTFISIIHKLKANSNYKLPLGRRGWPIIGETLDLIMEGKRGHPEKFFNNRMAKYDQNVFKTCLFGESMAMFSGAAGNKFLFSNENKYVTNWFPRSAQSLIFHDGLKENYPLIRKMLLLDLLKPETLRHYIPTMDIFLKEHFETEWLPHKDVKVYNLTKNCTLTVACRLFLNVQDHNCVKKFFDLLTDVSTGIISLPINLPGTNFYKAMKAGKIFKEEILGVIREKKRELLENNYLPANDDLATKVLLAKDEHGNGFGENDIANLIFALLFASHESTSVSMTNTTNFLAEYHHIYEQVLKENMEIAKSKAPGEYLNWDDIKKMKYSWCVVCESMRLLPPCPGTFREAITDFEFSGFTIPKGWKIHWSPYTTHKNPEYFSDPDKFEPSRFEGNGPAKYTFVPFGGGPSMCVGREYARMIILVYVHNLVTKFKFEKVNPEEDFYYNPNPTPANGLHIRLHRND